MSADLPGMPATVDTAHAELDAEEAALAAVCAARHSSTLAELARTLDMLGLGGERDARPEPGPRIAPLLVHRRARRTAGRRG